MPRKKLSEQIEKISTSEAKTSGKKDTKRTNKKSYKIDLRILPPTNLGPFSISGLALAPSIIKLCKVKKIDIIGVVDRYQGDFVDKLQKVSSDYQLTILPALDLQLKVDKYDDIILTCFLKENESALIIKELLSKLRVDASCYGKDVYPVPLSLDDTLKIISEYNGVVLPSRIDKTPNRKCAIPTLVEKYGFKTFEVAYPEETKLFFKKRWPKEKFNLFSFSNANALAQVGNRIEKVKLNNSSFDGLKELLVRDSNLSSDSHTVLN